jgi:hypothetical protein
MASRSFTKRTRTTISSNNWETVSALTGGRLTITPINLYYPFRALHKMGNIIGKLIFSVNNLGQHPVALFGTQEGKVPVQFFSKPWFLIE